jgi:uncharacterized protein (DUF302 family)
MNEFSIEVNISKPYNEAIDSVKEALKDQGFGVLTEIDVKATMKTKLDKEFRHYSILGAWNPPLAYKTLSHVPGIGLLLPFNVTVEATDDGGSIIWLLDPKLLVMIGTLRENITLLEVANDTQARLIIVAEALKE